MTGYHERTPPPVELPSDKEVRGDQLWGCVGILIGLAVLATLILLGVTLL
jgi:hypothetical protein